MIRWTLGAAATVAVGSVVLIGAGVVTVMALGAYLEMVGDQPMARRSGDVGWSS